MPASGVRELAPAVETAHALAAELIPPKPPQDLGLKPVPTRDLAKPAAHKDWPHAPVHRLSENGVYVVTAGTLHKQHLFDSNTQRDLLEGLLLAQAKACGWDLEAWAVFSNHYHFVARGNPNSVDLREFIRGLHSLSARELSRLDGRPGRAVWHNFWDTRLTYQHAYLARLNYVHQNAVRHRLVPVANQYRWCSAAWFERVASPAQVKSIYGFKIDRVKATDDF
jgi:putative transposase